MKKLAFLAFLISAFPVSAMAADMSSGCGLGWQVTQKNSLLASTIRNTTHAVLPNTFSMTFGSSGCGQHSIVQADRPAFDYLASNYDPVMMEMADGRGEYLEGFARAMGCDESATLDFARMTRSNIKSITNDGKATPVETFYNVKNGIKANPVLSRACSA